MWLKRLLILSFIVQTASGCVTTVNSVGPVGKPEGAYNRQAWGFPFHGKENGDENGLLLASTVYFPTGGTSPYPLVILNHGGKAIPTGYYDKQAKWFTDLGYVVVLPTRRGYGQSQGTWSEGYGPCSDSNYVASGLAASEDILSANEYFSAIDFIDQKRVILAGHSAGGFGSIAAASRNPQGVVGVINFSGARGSKAAGTNCSPKKLVEAIKHFGETSTIPSLWIYGGNDIYFRPDLTQKMYNAFSSVSQNKSEFHLLEGAGHEFFSTSGSIKRWAPIVMDFLRQVDPKNEKLFSTQAELIPASN